LTAARPRISIVIPAFEAGRYLLDAVDSVRRQQGLVFAHDVEVVIADDGASRQDSLDALAEVASWPGVCIVKTSGRTGPSNARNLASAVARGEWLSFLDADDLYAQDALTARLQAAQRCPEAACVATDYAEFDAALKEPPSDLPGVIEHFPARRVPVEQAYRLGTEICLRRPLWAFVGAIPLWTGAVLVKRSLFKELGGFPTRHFIGEDLHLWLRIAASADIVFLPRITSFCRKGHASLTSGERAMNLKMARCYEDLLADPLMQTVRQPLQQLIADAYLGQSYTARQNGAVRDAVLMALRALRWTPRRRIAWKALFAAMLPVRP
jgi:GT2 family glycosyltransferase